jgi:GAF domain-containing protein
VEPAQIPTNEPKRLDVLRSLAILDSESDAGFDGLVELAKTLFDLPMVAVSLVDEQRQWFKASIGLGVCETHREVSFCAHIVEKPKVMVVEDAMLDDRFYDNPLVTEEPFIRFYAGAPLRPVGDEVLGTLCVMHTRPRSFSDDEQQLLKLLAGQAEQLIQLHALRHKKEGN